MSVLKVQNKGNKGNPYHESADGTFTSQTGDGDTNKQTNVPFLKQKNNQNNENLTLPSFLKKKENNQNENLNSTWKKFKKDKWWKERKLMTPEELEQKIGEFFDDDVCNFLVKYGLKTTNDLGASKTSHSGINETLTNAIAQKQFQPLKVLDSDEFDDLVKINNLTKNYRNAPFQNYALAQRGFSNKNIINIYTGKQKSDCLLPNGVYGSCIYSAYDINPITKESDTAGNYAGYGGYIMSYLIDNTQNKNITSDKYSLIRKDVKNRSQQIKNNISDTLKKQGKDDDFINNVMRIFDNTLNNDYTFPALLLGYDVIYETSADYTLILNWKNIYTKKDW